MVNIHIYLVIRKCDGGITVSIAAFQAVDPSSTPGHRKLICLCFPFCCIWTIPISYNVEVLNELNANYLTPEQGLEPWTVRLKA